MYSSNKTFYIFLSVALSLLVHILIFMISWNLTIRPGIASEMIQKPSKFLKLGTITLPSETKEDFKPQLKQTHEPVKVPDRYASQNFPGNKLADPSGKAGIKNTPAPDVFKLPKSPSDGAFQKILEIDGGKLEKDRLAQNRLIVPKIPRTGSPDSAGGGSGIGEGSAGPIELKLRVPMPLRNPNMPTPGSRLLPDENLSNIDSLMDVRLFKHIDHDGNGFFRIDISPRKKFSSLKPFEKDIVFCIDTSGSISKDKLVEFKDGVRKALQKMNSGDRFEIVSFKHKAFPLFGELKNPDPALLEKTDKFLKRLERSGSTDIYAAIAPFTDPKMKTEGRPFILFLASDGNTNTGEVYDSRTLINEISNRNQDNLSIFTFSSGLNRNPFLLELLAYRNRGENFSSDSIKKSGLALENFIEEVSSIIVMNLDYQVSSSLADDAFPKKLPHLYSQHTLSVYGKFPAETKEIGLRITGVDSLGKRQELVYAGNLEDALIDDESLPKKWALQYIYNLYSRLTVEYNEDVKNEIHKLADTYGLDVPYLDKYLLKYQPPEEEKPDFKDIKMEF
ncbi:MAG TPA: hypothetical protein DCZ94_12660 [Lentisphaeria bacterium]|nr:MAG: hypothetical protein A2X48_21350 [Lentisphaerae bacterium GWF2_49_21]HBC87798.1 hypothetical protein [Lentisphaeria bacterium]